MKKVILFSFLTIIIAIAIYIYLLLHPSIFYAHELKIDQVTIYSEEKLSEDVNPIVRNALKIAMACPLFDQDHNIEICLNDDKTFPSLHPFAGGIAYSYANKTVFYWASPDFERNRAKYVREEEAVEVDLTWLIAHEFIHNYQYHEDLMFPTKLEFWQQEGYAEYYSRQWQNDGKLCDRLKQIKDSTFINDFSGEIYLEDGTIQNSMYFKYATLMQYLIEIKKLTFKDLLDNPMDEASVIQSIEELCDRLSK